MNPPISSFGQSDAVLLRDEEAASKVLHDAVMGLWEVVNSLTRLRRSSRQNYRVTIFGSARLAVGTPAYEAVKELAAQLTRLGCDIISGGGPGLMKAANEGAHAAAPGALQRSVGIRVDLPFEQEINAFVGQAYAHGTFFSRLHHFMLVSDAFIVVPGGIGTLLELSLAWQLLQVRRLYNVPLIVVGQMWSDLVDWGRRNMLQEGRELAGEMDFAIPRCVSTIEEAIKIVEESRAAWLAGQQAGSGDAAGHAHPATS
jgi:uncharacterized protein (TIGR00730 family)